ncbi:MAG: hypothetical protein ACHQUC_08390, partial [Chlamydiales bacterium]
ERIPKYDDWIEGIISEIEYDEQHKMSYKGEEKVASCVRFKFALKGCEFPHRSRWMTFSYGEKANLFKKYLSNLVEDAEPDMDFDLDDLKGFEIKTMWKEEGEYDSLELIRPLGKKFTPKSTVAAEKVDEEVSF